MKIDGATLLITGANRGIGLAFAHEALARGARKVFAGARDPASVTLAGVVPIRLDVSSPADVAAAAAACGEVTIVINNAGIALTGTYLTEASIDLARRHFETNCIGPLRIARAFAPILAGHGGGALLNVLSIASWINSPQLGTYGMSKAAAWAMTNGLRSELAAQKTQVLGLHMGFVDTDMTADFDVPKVTPEEVVRAAFDGLEAGAWEVLADPRTREVHAGLTAEPAVYLVPLQRPTKKR